METNSLTNLWKIDVIDRILTFSLLTKKSSKNFNMDFYWATFSIQTSVKIYSDRVRLLSSSMESLLFFLPGKINKFLDYDNKLGKKRNSTELNKFRTYEKLIFCYGLNRIDFRLIFSQKFNFKVNEPVSKKILKKNLKTSSNPTVSLNNRNNISAELISKISSTLNCFKIRGKEKIVEKHNFECLASDNVNLKIIFLNKVLNHKTQTRIQDEKNKRFFKIKKILNAFKMKLVQLFRVDYKFGPGSKIIFSDKLNNLLSFIKNSEQSYCYLFPKTLFSWNFQIKLSNKPSPTFFLSVNSKLLNGFKIKKIKNTTSRYKYLTKSKTLLPLNYKFTTLPRRRRKINYNRYKKNKPTFNLLKKSFFLLLNNSEKNNSKHIKSHRDIHFKKNTLKCYDFLKFKNTE